MSKPVVESRNPITYTEVHASVLGAVVGVLVGYASAHGFRSVAVGVVFVIIALGIGVRGAVPMAQRTLRREPWYGLAAFLLGSVVGTMV
ncbi:hypothetical protein [Haladaptatus sp. NG-WS-4]